MPLSSNIMAHVAGRNFELTAIDNARLEDATICKLIVDEKYIRYVLVEPQDYRVHPPGILIDGPDDPAVPFPTLAPAGEWYLGRILKDKKTGKPHFVIASNADYPFISPVSVKDPWHPTRIDYFDKDLHTLRRAVKSAVGCKDQLRVVTHPKLLDGRPVLMKTFDFPMQCHGINIETRAYRTLANKGLTPEFLGHVTAEGNVIGFFLEWIDMTEGDGDGEGEGERSIRAGIIALRR